MLYSSHDAEQAQLFATAQAMCAAARTAPKTKGQDYLETCIVTGDDLEPLAAKMEELSDAHNAAFLRRDAGNIRSSGAVVLLGAKNVPHGINGLCQYCGFPDCAAAETTVFAPIIKEGCFLSPKLLHIISNPGISRYFTLR